MTAGALLDELQRPECFPHGPEAVEIVQTHLSVVCLAGDLVYKLKKAKTLPFVDFGTFAARRRAAIAEVELNRRLCPDVYLGVALLQRDDDGSLRFEATVDVVDADAIPADGLDVAVVMRRLPQDRMLDELLAAGGATAVDVEQLRGLARTVASFHAGADCGEDVAAHGSPARLAGFAADNFRDLAQLPDSASGVPGALGEALARVSARNFDRLLPALETRAASGRVVDGHGDLHARNICMTTPPVAYDCIEFEPAFRCGDVATEIAFLAMDLRYRGAPELAAEFVAAYVSASGDTQIPGLLPALCSYRAMVRAKVAAIAAAEARDDEARRAPRRSAMAHVRLAAACALEAAAPWWIVVCGPPASGKSTFSKELNRTLRWPVIATDRVRKDLAGLEPTQRGGPELYTWQFTRRTYFEVLARASRNAARGVVLDGNFPAIALRSRARAAAAESGARLALVYLDVDDEEAAARAAARAARGGSVSDAGVAVARDLRARFEIPGAAEQSIELAGARPVEELVDELLVALLGRA